MMNPQTVNAPSNGKHPNYDVNEVSRMLHPSRSAGTELMGIAAVSMMAALPSALLLLFLQHLGTIVAWTDLDLDLEQLKECLWPPLGVWRTLPAKIPIEVDFINGETKKYKAELVHEKDGIMEVRVNRLNKGWYLRPSDRRNGGKQAFWRVREDGAMSTSLRPTALIDKKAKAALQAANQNGHRVVLLSDGTTCLVENLVEEIDPSFAFSLMDDKATGDYIRSKQTAPYLQSGLLILGLITILTLVFVWLQGGNIGSGFTAMHSRMDYQQFQLESLRQMLQNQTMPITRPIPFPTGG